MSKTDSGVRRIPIWLWVVVVLLLFVVLAFQAGSIEWEEIETDLGFSEKAQRNPYLAAQMFLQEWGAEVTTSSGLRILDNMPDVADTIVITSSRYSLSQRRSDQLSQWLNDGGHLVVMVSAEYDGDLGKSGDKLLDELGIYLADPPEEEQSPLDPSYEEGLSPEEYEEQAFTEEYYDLQRFQEELERQVPQASEDANPESGESELTTDMVDEENTAATDTVAEQQEEGDEIVSRTLKEILTELGETTEFCNDLGDFTRVSVAGEEEEVVAHLWSHHVIYYTDEKELAWASNSEGTQLLQVEVGNGRLTALTDTAVWNNRRIVCHDHAYLLWALVRDGGKVWISYNESMPGIFDLLKKHAPWVLVWFIGLLFVWIWARTLQFGPLFASESNLRRDFMDHLSASARYLQRSEQGKAGLELLRSQILTHLQQRFPGFEKLSQDEQRVLILEVVSSETESQENLGSIKQALFADAPQQEGAFIEMLKTLQRLKQLLKVNDF